MINLLKQRRSTRKFKPEKIEKGNVESLKKALLLSPTSRNIDSLEFIFIDDKDTLDHLSKCKPHGAAFLKGAPLGIVVLGNEERSDVWVEDASIASIVVQLEAEDLGLGSCWIQIRKRVHGEGKSAEEYIRERFNIKENYRVESIIAVGYKGETRDPLSEDKMDFSKIHVNEFTVE